MLVMMMVAVSAGACGGETFELIPKVWFTEPPGVKRMTEPPFEVMGSNPWLEPSKNAADFGMVMGTLFKTVADWDPHGGKSFNGSFPTFAVRVLNDNDADALLSQEQFLGKVREIARRSASVNRTKFVKRTDRSARDEPKQTLSVLEKYIALTKDSFAVAVMLTSSNQQDRIELISKRYLNVDGRFFYLGVRDFVDGGVEKVESRAGEHAAWLRQWEQGIRQLTREKRLKEFGGDETKMNAAIAQEIDGWRQAKREKELREREILMARLRDESHSKQRMGLRKRVSIFGGLHKESGVHGRYRGIGGLVVMVLDAMGISAGWVLVFIFMAIALFIVLLFIRLDRNWRCFARANDYVVEAGAVKDGWFKCVQCGTAYLSDDAVLIGLHGNRRMIKVSNEKSVSVETVVTSKVPVCKTCEKALFDKIGRFNLATYAVCAGVFTVASAFFYALRFTLGSALFMGVAIIVVAGFAFIVTRKFWLARFGVDVDAYFMRVNELRRLKIALGFCVGKSTADIQQSVERAKEPLSANTSGKAVRNVAESGAFPEISSGGAMEMLRVADEKARVSRQNIADGQLAFLNAGKDGILRSMLWKQQKKIIVDQAKCRLFLPEGWNLTPEIESQGTANVIAKFAGPGVHEWASVEYLLLSPDHVEDDLGDWVNVSKVLFGRLSLHAHSDKESGVANCKEILLGRLGSRDALYMKYHQADSADNHTAPLSEEIVRSLPRSHWLRRALRDHHGRDGFSESPPLPA